MEAGRVGGNVCPFSKAVGDCLRTLEGMGTYYAGSNGWL